MAHMREEHGFTLIELLVTMLIAMLVLSAGFTIFMSSNQATSLQNVDNRAQDNARMAMDILARNIRRAGFLVDFNSYALDTKIGGETTKMRAANSASQPDAVTIVGGTLTSLGLLQFNAPQDSETITVAGDLWNVHKDDIIGVGLTYSGKVAEDPDQATGVVKLDKTTTRGKLNMFYPGLFSSGTISSGMDPVRVRILGTTRYEINPDAPLRLHPRLMQVTSGGIAEPIAEDIEDLQIAYGVDRDNDRMISPGEWTNVPALANIDQIRLVRITIVARSSNPDPELEEVAQTIPAIEDRPQQANVKDGYRRYILTRIVRCRGLEALSML